MAKAVGIGLLTLLFAPATLLLGMGALLNPAAQASCLPSTSAVVAVEVTVPETARVVFPLPAGTWVRTSGFGMRVHPVTGEYKLHTGVDFAAASGTHLATEPILAAGRIELLHYVREQAVSYAYHRYGSLHDARLAELARSQRRA